jgi:hypothetical protein
MHIFCKTKISDQEHKRKGCKCYLWRVHGKANRNGLGILKAHIISLKRKTETSLRYCFLPVSKIKIVLIDM